MCGICGIINFSENPVNKENIWLMMQKIKHRGPDDEGVYIDGNVGLGHVRLSILDLSSAGHQPMYSFDRRYIIVFNGEIYNYIELKKELSNSYEFKTKTDTEVILAAYDKWGEDCLHNFNGDWAFVLYDTVNHQLFGARDRYGIKPFYYILSEESLYFASEIKALIPNNVEPNYKNIFDYLVYNRTDHNANTFFKDINKLEHGMKFSISKGKIRFSKWYNLKEEIQKDNNISFDESTNIFNDILKNSISIRLRSDVPVGVCLSGGLDSSIIVSHLIRSFDKHDLNTFSAIYEGFEYADESKFIRIFENELSNMHYTCPNAESFYNDYLKFIDAQTEPVASIGPYAQFKVMELAKENVKVTIDGQGADEELAGYHYFFASYFKELLFQFRIVQFLKELLSYIHYHKSLYAIKYFLFYLIPVSLKNIIGSKYNGFISTDFYHKWGSRSDIKLELYNPESLSESLYQHFENKLEHLLKWEDHNSMHFSIESRVPFLDHRIVEFTLGLNSNRIINNGTTKYILREASKGILPEEIRVRRDKKGFSTPADLWFKEKKFRDLVSNTINSRSFQERDIYDIKQVNKQFNNHMKGISTQTKNIWKWLNLEIWFRKYVDRK